MQILLALLLVPFLNGLIDQRQLNLAFLVHQAETLPPDLLFLFLCPSLELRHFRANHIRQHHRHHPAHQSAFGISEESPALVGGSTRHHIIIEGDFARQRVFADTMLAPSLIVVGQPEEVVLLRPRATLVVLQHRLNLGGIGEEMLPFRIEGTLEECRHTDVRLDDTNASTRILYLFAVLLRQRIRYLLLPFHLVLFDNGIHEQLKLIVNKRLTRSLRSLDVDDEAWRVQLTVSILGPDAGCQRAQHRQSCYQRSLPEFLRSVVGEILQNAGQLVVD